MKNILQKAFNNYANKSDLMKGKILPLELTKDSLRMRLDEKELLIKIESNDLELFYIDKETDKVYKDLGKSSIESGFSNLEELFDKIKSETISKYEYSLNNLHESIKDAL